MNTLGEAREKTVSQGGGIGTSFRAGDEESARRLADSEARNANPPAAARRPVKIYQLNPHLKYRRARLDLSEYPGRPVYHGPINDRGPGDAPARSGGAATAPGLLNGHISSRSVHNPFDEGRIEIWEGAALIKVTKQGRHAIHPENEPDRRRRGRVQEFSRASRRRMRLFMAKVRLDELQPLFGTTTYPDIFPDDAAKFKRDLETLIERLKRRFPNIGLVWRLEFQTRKSGVNVGKVAPHFHWLLWNVPRVFDFKPESGKWVKVRRGPDDRWCITVKYLDGEKVATVHEPATGQDRFTEWLSRNWYDVAGTGELKHFRAGTNVKLLNSKRQVFFYVSKYMGKVEGGLPCAFPGRFWGVVNPKNIPTGKRTVVICSGKQAAQLMRVMRRYVQSLTPKRVRFNRWSVSCICEASAWLRRLPELLGVNTAENPF